jgi:hypothetical protein
MVTDLGEQPTPEIEPAEPAPGGVDAVEESAFDEPPVVPDLTLTGNQRAKDEMPEALTEPDDTQTEASSSNGSDEPEKEPSG